MKLAPLPVAIQISLLLITLVAAAFDVRYRRIPNWLVLAGLLLGFVSQIAFSGWSGLKNAALGCGLGFLLYFPLYLLRARGAGDVKLLAAVGASIGPGNCFLLFLLAAVSGGVMALGLVLVKGQVLKTFWNVGWILRDLSRFRRPYERSEAVDVRSDKSLRLPHGLVIACASLLLVAALQNFWRQPL